MGQRGLPANSLGDHRSDQRRIGAQLVVLVRVLVQGINRAGDGVPRRVVAADDQQHDVAVIVPHTEVPGGLGVGHHRDKIELRRRIDPLVPELGKPTEALIGLLALVLPAFGRAVAGHVGEHVGPVGQQPPVFLREVEQRGQRHGRQLFGHQVDPIELYADRQPVQDCPGPLADQGCHGRQVGGCDDRADGFALHVVLRGVHTDKAGAARPLFRLGLGLQRLQRDTVRGREHLVIGVDRDDVVVPGDRPVGAVLAVGRVVDRGLSPQALEIGPHGVGGEQFGLGRVKGLERQGVDVSL